MWNEEKKRKGQGEAGGRMATAIMYKLYTYVHEIFLSTTIITFNYNYSWNFFTVMLESRGIGKEGRKNDWELEVFDSRDLACSEHEKNTERERRCNENNFLKKRGKEKEKSDRCYKIKTRYSRENYTGKFTKIYCTISPAEKRNYGKNLTIVEI